MSGSGSISKQGSAARRDAASSVAFYDAVTLQLRTLTRQKRLRYNKTMRHKATWIEWKPLHGCLLICSMVVFAAVAQSRQEPTTPTIEKPDKTQTPPPRSTSGISPRHHASRPPADLPPSARMFYQVMWGVDSLGVKSVESGQMIRFSYRVIDVEKAKGLNDKKATPFLIDEKARVKLVVPSMEKVGQLRQSSTPEAGKSYWMVFSNKGNFVKRGNRVSVVIGRFRVDGLVVQ